MKKRILIASVLKPVNDARNYEKTAISLADAGYTVGVAGRKLSTSSQSRAGIEFLEWFDFPRMGLKRLFSSHIFFIQALRWKPDVLVITTWELLYPAIWLHVFLRIPLVYDVQENYFRNLKYSRVYPFMLRMPLALYVRMMEKIAGFFIRTYFVAEQCYREEISGLTDAVLLENKCRRPASLNRPAFSSTTYLYTGTISENYGVRKAIEYVISERNNIPDLRLIIAGYAPQHAYYLALRKEFSSHAFIEWEGGDVLVPHARIVDLINTAHAGIISYLPDPSTENCIPTKLYEYLGHGLKVILLSDNARWKRMVEERGSISKEEYYWEGQEGALIESIGRLVDRI